MSVSLPYPAACVAGNDAPRVNERAATRGRVAMEVAMSTATPKMESPAPPREPERPRRTTRPGTAHGRQYTRPPSLPGIDAPLIGERAATRGRNATESGDEGAGVEHVICSRASPANWNAPGERRDQGRARSSMTTAPRPHASAFIAYHDPPLIDEHANTRGNLEYRIQHLLSATTSSAPLRTEAAPLAVAETRHVREPPAKMRSCLIVMSDASRQSRARSSSAKSSLSFLA